MKRLVYIFLIIALTSCANNRNIRFEEDKMSVIEEEEVKKAEGITIGSLIFANSAVDGIINVVGKATAVPSIITGNPFAIYGGVKTAQDTIYEAKVGGSGDTAREEKNEKSAEEKEYIAFLDKLYRRGFIRCRVFAKAGDAKTGDEKVINGKIKEEGREVLIKTKCKIVEELVNGKKFSVEMYINDKLYSSGTAAAWIK